MSRIGAVLLLWQNEIGHTENSTRKGLGKILIGLFVNQEKQKKSVINMNYYIIHFFVLKVERVKSNVCAFQLGVFNIYFCNNYE